MHYSRHRLTATVAHVTTLTYASIGSRCLPIDQFVRNKTVLVQFSYVALYMLFAGSYTIQCVCYFQYFVCILSAPSRDLDLRQQLPSLDESFAEPPKYRTPSPANFLGQCFTYLFIRHYCPR